MQYGVHSKARRVAPSQSWRLRAIILQHATLPVVPLFAQHMPTVNRAINDYVCVGIYVLD